jgi:ectoine hydroxylase-related dioxygenase (phytanoyl-CoA dioxygenase family)
MEDTFAGIVREYKLPGAIDQQLSELGFVIVPGPVLGEGLNALADAYDVAVESASSADVSIGRSTTRVSDLVNRGPVFDALYVFPPLLAASLRVIGRPFKLSTMHARTLRPYSTAQDFHLDFAFDPDGFPMLGFILMLDEFRPDNGATRFIGGSHLWNAAPEDFRKNLTADREGQMLACGPAGSLILYNGSVWHGHGANLSAAPRRSIQGAYIRRESPSWINLPARMTPATLSRIGPLAKYLIGC